MPTIDANIVPIAIALKRVYDRYIVDHCAKNPDAGWTQKNSLEVVELIAAEDVEAAVKAGEDMAKYTPSQAAIDIWNKVINPSAHRQVLERTPRSIAVNGCTTVLRKQPESAKRSGPAAVEGL